METSPVYPNMMIKMDSSLIAEPWSQEVESPSSLWARAVAEYECSPFLCSKTLAVMEPKYLLSSVLADLVSLFSLERRFLGDYSAPDVRRFSFFIASGGEGASGESPEALSINWRARLAPDDQNDEQLIPPGDSGYVFWGI